MQAPLQASQLMAKARGKMLSTECCSINSGAMATTGQIYVAQVQQESPAALTMELLGHMHTRLQASQASTARLHLDLDARNRQLHAAVPFKVSAPQHLKPSMLSSVCEYFRYSQAISRAGAQKSFADAAVSLKIIETDLGK